MIRADAKDIAVCARNCFFQLESPMVTTGESSCMFNCARLHHDARGYMLEKFYDLKWSWIRFKIILDWGWDIDIR